MFEIKELGCDYYYNNASGENVIPDQEERRRLEDAHFLKDQEEQMLADIEADTRAMEIAVEINIIKRDTAEIFARNSIKIGQRLREVKELLPHGDFERWLRDNVDYSVTTAQRFMKLANAYEGQLAAGDDDVAELLASMLPSKGYILAQLAPAQCKEFVQENDVENMSSRELQAAVKAKEDAENRAEKAEQAAEAEQQRADAAEEARADLAAQLEDLQRMVQAVQSGGQISPEERAKIEAEAKKAAEDAAKVKIEAAKKKADKELEKARAEGADALKKAQAEQEKVIQVAVEQAKAEAKAEAEKATAARVAELEEQISVAASNASPYRIKFGACYEVFQADYGRLVAIVDDAEQHDPDEGAMLRSMLDKILDYLKV